MCLCEVSSFRVSLCEIVHMCGPVRLVYLLFIGTTSWSYRSREVLPASVSNLDTQESECLVPICSLELKEEPIVGQTQGESHVHTWGVGHLESAYQKGGLFAE